VTQWRGRGPSNPARPPSGHPRDRGAGKPICLPGPTAFVLRRSTEPSAFGDCPWPARPCARPSATSSRASPASSGEASWRWSSWPATWTSTTWPGSRASGQRSRPGLAHFGRAGLGKGSCRLELPRQGGTGATSASTSGRTRRSGYVPGSGRTTGRRGSRSTEASSGTGPATVPPIRTLPKARRTPASPCGSKCEPPRCTARSTSRRSRRLRCRKSSPPASGGSPVEREATSNSRVMAKVQRRALRSPRPVHSRLWSFGNSRRRLRRGQHPRGRAPHLAATGSPGSPDGQYLLDLASAEGDHFDRRLR
jgi:hypothetical protein